MFFLFGGRRGFRRMGPAGMAFALYRGWRRLSPEQKAQITARARALAAGARSRRSGPGTFH